MIHEIRFERGPRDGDVEHDVEFYEPPEEIVTLDPAARYSLIAQTAPGSMAVPTTKYVFDRLEGVTGAAQAAVYVPEGTREHTAEEVAGDA